MANSQCTSCGLIHQHGQCRQQSPPEMNDFTPAICCWFYFSTITFLFLFCFFVFSLSKLAPKDSCYIELFANSVSVSYANTNVTAADVKIGFVARNQSLDCKISLHALKSRLLQGDQVISNSSSSASSDFFGQLLVAGDKTNVVFENVVMPEVVIGDVIWDLQVEIMSAVKTDVSEVNGFLMAACPDISVKFTTDPAGKMMGSLLGNIRRCDYVFQHKLA